MIEYIDYFEDDLPAVYELKPHDEGSALVVSAHSDFLNYLEDVTRDSKKPYYTMIASELRIASLTGFKDLSLPWGFGDIFMPSSREAPDWVSWCCRLPNKSASFWCDAASLSASLGLFTFLARAYTDNSKTNSTVPQAFFVDLQTERGKRDIWIDLTKDAVRWIAKQEETEQQPHIVSAMKKAYENMMGREVRRDEFIEARIRKPYWLNLQVPGDRVGLDPRGYDAPLGEGGKPILRGYPLLPHNVDTSLQQLTLLMGMAALGDAVISDRVESK